MEGNAPAPQVLQEFILKERFGWTQAELEAEYIDDLEAYVRIIDLQNQMRAKKDE